MTTTILMTGANTGIGRAAAEQLASPGVHLVLACRSLERTRPVLAEVQRRGATAEFLELDLSNLGQAMDAGRAFAASHDALDILVNNAGIAGGQGLTQDGWEVAFGTNHLGHFAFTLPLLPLLDAAEGRVVHVSSGRHYEARTLPFERLRTPNRGPVGMRQYAVSKLCNILFTAEIRRRYSRISATSMNPGRIASDIFRRAPGPLRKLLPILFRMESAATGGALLVHAIRAEAKGEALPLYFDRRSPRTPSPLARDEALAKRLWDFSKEAIDALGNRA
ncbi:MAG: SDR family NAD(P)-dependent oxidoreductase [Polyangiaceae bacterium]